MPKFKRVAAARTGQDGNSVISSVHPQSEGGGAGADQSVREGTRSRASRATTSRRYDYQSRSLEFVIDIPELVQNVKLEPHEPVSQDEVRLFE
jgi:hypothetical protein